MENIFFILALCCAFLCICKMHRLLVLMGKASTQAIYSFVGPEFLEFPARKRKSLLIEYASSGSRKPILCMSISV